MHKGRAVRGALWLGVAACALALAFGAVVRLLGGFPGVTEANYQRLRPGMHLQDVEALFGGPSTEGVGGDTWIRTWRGAEGEAVVFFWRNRVEKAFFVPASRPPPAPRDPLGPVRSWLGW
jgi:hypothetical protein